VRKVYKISIFLILVMLINVSCRESQNEAFPPFEYTEKQGGTFVRELPTYREGKLKGEVDWVYDYFKKQTVDLGLDTIQQGFNGLQIRIWLSHWLAIKKHLVILKYTNKKWSGQLVTMTYAYNDSLHEHYISKKDFKEIIPQGGWAKFGQMLNHKKILDLPDMNQLPGYESGEDGMEYVFEISTPNKYRMYHYWEPSSYKNKYWQAKNVLAIGSLLNDEFNIQYTK
jgi:hypothetical protein